MKDRPGASGLARSLRNTDAVLGPCVESFRDGGLDMDHMAARRRRIGAVALVVAVLASGICRVRVAEAGEQASILSGQAAARGQRLGGTPSVSSAHQVEPGSMRYYGGPKSPAWRAPPAK